MKLIIDHINSKIEEIGLFPFRFGLCERIKELERVFPAEYCKGEYKQVSDFDKGGTVYHRLTGDISSSEADEESSVSCDPFIERTYPMRTVGAVKKGNYTDLEIAEFIAKKISFINNKALRAALSADSVSVEVNGFSTDRDKIWSEEYTGVEMKMPYEYAYVAIDYDIIITGNNSCFPNSECDGI
jgi:hypothetical protein